MANAIITHVRTGLRIVGLVGLHAVGDAGVAAWSRRHCDRAIIVTLVVVITLRVVTRSAVITALRSERTADDGSCNQAGNEGATAVIAATATIPAATKP